MVVRAAAEHGNDGILEGGGGGRTVAWITKCPSDDRKPEPTKTSAEERHLLLHHAPVVRVSHVPFFEAQSLPGLAGGQVRAILTAPRGGCSEDALPQLTAASASDGCLKPAWKVCLAARKCRRREACIVRNPRGQGPACATGSVQLPDFALCRVAGGDTTLQEELLPGSKHTQHQQPSVPPLPAHTARRPGRRGGWRGGQVGSSDKANAAVFCHALKKPVLGCVG